MKLFKIFKQTTIISFIALSLAACGFSSSQLGSIFGASDNEKSGFPYHPFVYNLDLSILAYQLYGQTLAWPFDPYYEEHDAKGSDRDEMIKKVHQWSHRIGAQQVKNSTDLTAYRGPGILLGLPNNANHDPIIYNYSQIYPWSDTLSSSVGKWTEYLTPKEITNQIKDVYVCARPAGISTQTVSFNKVTTAPSKISERAKNILLGFEGGTGDKGELGQPASQSLMGFVLVREKSQGDYDLHIAFRGSRSGSAGRAVIEAISQHKARGNPDWITDLGYDRLSAGQGTAHISTLGKIHRGFAKSMASIYPNLFYCLDQADRLKAGTPPTNIYVTGHSLGGALAQAFVSSVLQGNRYGPNGNGINMPTSLRDWPWRKIKLVSFSAPRIGDEIFARTLTEQKLQSEFFSSAVNPIDTKALRPNDGAAFNRLIDPTRPAGFRVLHSKDPITSEKGAGGKHVGKSVYVNATGLQGLVTLPDFSAHEQRVVRDNMLENINDPSIPKWGMRYQPMDKINPERNKKNKGSLSEIRKLAAAVKRYYVSRGLWFNEESFDRALAERMSIEKSQ